MNRRKNDRWQGRLTWIALVLNIALFAMNLAATVIFVNVATKTASLNARIESIIETLEHRQKRQAEAWGGAGY